MSHRRPATALVALLLLVAGLLAGCSSDEEGTREDSHATRLEALQQVLDQRARAIRSGDLEAFLAGLDRSNKALVLRQRRYFANLRQLPLKRFGYRVLDRSWSGMLADPAWGDVALPQVEVTTQLAGYDTRPVHRLTGLALSQEDGRWLIVSDRTRNGGFFPGAQPSPWEMTRIRVRESGSVLGIYDEKSYADSERVNEVVRKGVDQVRDALPFSWAGRVVVYEFADKRVLESFDNVPGGNIDHLGAMTFPVYTRPGGSRTASSRFVLMPGSVAAGEPFLGRITRHELAHVALGTRDDGVPTWFAEGLAEYVGARPVEPSQRRIASEAVSRARSGVSGMPASATFNGRDQAWNYALAWMACDWIAEEHGEARLWRLMDALHAGGTGTPDDGQDQVLRDVLGIDGAGLAQRAADRILAIYG